MYHVKLTMPLREALIVAIMIAPHVSADCHYQAKTILAALGLGPDVLSRWRIVRMDADTMMIEGLAHAPVAIRPQAQVARLSADLVAATEVCQGPVDLIAGQTIAMAGEFIPCVRRDGKELSIVAGLSPDLHAATVADWLTARILSRGGFRVDHVSVDRVEARPVIRRPSGTGASRLKPIYMTHADVRVTLTVTDPAFAMQALRRGFGRHGAFGYGGLFPVTADAPVTADDLAEAAA